MLECDDGDVFDLYEMSELWEHKAEGQRHTSQEVGEDA